MSTPRLRIGKQLEKSSTPRSIAVTNASNELGYLSPGSNNTVLTIVSGVPTWQAITFPSEYEQFANKAARPATGATDVIYFSTSEGVFSIWNGSAYIDVPTAPNFTVAGSAGTNQTITAGNTLTIQGAANSGIVTTGTATDIIAISINEVKEYFAPAAAATTVTASQTPIAASLDVYRNGLLQELTTDYTLAGAVVTFTESFGASTGGTLQEVVALRYKF